MLYSNSMMDIIQVVHQRKLFIFHQHLKEIIKKTVQKERIFDHSSDHMGLG